MRGRKQPARPVVTAAALALALGLAACSTTSTDHAGGSSTTAPSHGPGSTAPGGSTAPLVPPSSIAPPAGLVVAPADVGPIVKADTAINNRANATLSLSLQDSHETCLQQQMDDINYRGVRRLGGTNFGGSFDQKPSAAYVPRQSSYPAFFSVLAEDVTQTAPGQPPATPTPAFLTYSKVSAAAPWKLASSTQILGPTPAGVALPTVRTGPGGYVTALPYGQRDGLVMAPSAVAARVAAAFTTEAQSGALPAGVAAEFGPASSSVDPHQLVEDFASAGKVTVKFSVTPPQAVAPALQGPGCQYPAYRLADGGALVVFPLFQILSLTSASASGVSQPADGSRFGDLLAPGTYASVRTIAGDVCVAVVPPAGSSAPVHVIGSGLEEVAATGVQGGLVIT